MQVGQQFLSSLLAGAKRPDIFKSYQQGRELVGSTALGQALAGGAPKEQVLATLGSYNPEAALPYLYGSSKGRTSVYDKQMASMQSPEAQAILNEFQEVSDEIVRMRAEDPGANIYPLTSKRDRLQQDFWNLTRMKIPGAQSNETLKQMAKDKRAILAQEKQDLAMSKFQFAKDNEKDSDIKEAIKSWYTDNKEQLGRFIIMDNIKSFITEADKGNAIARKNLVAASSRLGSNEALSDSEMELLRSGNIGDMLSAFFTRVFGSGAKISDADVANAKNQLRSMTAQQIPAFRARAKQTADSIAKQYGGDSTQILDQMIRGKIVPTVKRNAGMEDFQ